MSEFRIGQIVAVGEYILRYKRLSKCYRKVGKIVKFDGSITCVLEFPDHTKNFFKHEILPISGLSQHKIGRFYV